MLVRFVTHDGVETAADAANGDTILACAKDNAISGIVGECGGAMACATCHGYIDDAWTAKLEEPTEAELAMLSGCIDVRAGSRLTCQVVLTPELDGIKIHVPESQT